MALPPELAQAKDASSLVDQPGLDGEAGNLALMMSLVVSHRYSTMVLSASLAPMNACYALVSARRVIRVRDGAK